MFPITIAWPTASIDAVMAAGLYRSWLPRHGRCPAEEKRCARRPGLDRGGLAVADFRLAALLYVRHQPGDAAGAEDGPARRSAGQATATRRRARCAAPNIATAGRKSARRITEGALIAGNGITVLEGGDAAYPAMLGPSATPDSASPWRPISTATTPPGGLLRRPDRGHRRAASKCACCWTASASAIFFRRILYRLQAGGVRRALPAHLAALAHAVPQHAQSPQDAGGGRRAGLHRRHEYRRGELPPRCSRKRLYRATFISGSTGRWCAR